MATGLAHVGSYASRVEPVKDTAERLPEVQQSDGHRIAGPLGTTFAVQARHGSLLQRRLHQGKGGLGVILCHDRTEIADIGDLSQRGAIELAAGRQQHG